MDRLFCTSCGNTVIPTMRICPNCGNKSFSETAPTSNDESHHTKNQEYTNNSVVGNNSASNAVDSMPETKEKEKWYQNWYVVALGYVCLFKLFGIFGAIAGIATYTYIKPKKGYLIALGASIAAATIVGVGVIILVANL